MTTRDPLELARWTLAQALVWIIYRTPQAVGETPCTKDIFDVANDLARREGIEQAAMLADLQRRDELLDHLKRGTFRAWGIAKGQTEHSPIPSTSWDTIDSFYTNNPKVGIAPNDVGSSDEDSARYRDVYVIPSEVEYNWPRRVRPYRRKINEYKRQAVDAAIRNFGLDALLGIPQKGREQEIIELVKNKHGGLKVSDRYVRERILLAKGT